MEGVSYFSVIPKGNRQDIVNATINLSYLWKYVKVLRLTKNMQLRNISSEVEASELKTFSEWVACIGDGDLGGHDDGQENVKIPDDIYLHFSGDPIEAIVKSTYPAVPSDNHDLSYLQDRSTLAPMMDIVDLVNRHMIDRNACDSRIYLSSNSMCKSDGLMNVLTDLQTPEYLNGLKCVGLSNHEMILKVRTPIMLLRNIDHFVGLCNGTHLIVTRLDNHVIEANILTGNSSGEVVFIPRMTLTPSHICLLFKFQRKFPFIVSYAMTIYKNQGQSLSHVDILLKKPVFTHGQLYVAVSRVTTRSGLEILASDDDNKSVSSTSNVVYKELLRMYK